MIRFAVGGSSGSVGVGCQIVKFRGSIVMEPFLVPGGEVGRDIKVFRNLRDGLDLDKEAGRACAFVRRIMRG